MSYRELGVFIRHLPQDSCTQTAIRDERLDDLANPEPQEPAESKFGPWSLLNYQIASLTDAVNRLHYATAVGKFKDIEPPHPVPRPGLKAADPRNPEPVVRYLEEMRAARRNQTG